MSMLSARSAASRRAAESRRLFVADAPAKPCAFPDCTSPRVGARGPYCRECRRAYTRLWKLGVRKPLAAMENHWKPSRGTLTALLLGLLGAPA